MHSGFKQMLRVAVRRKLVHMDDQRDWIAARKFLCPTDDKFFRVIIEVPLVERRRIHRVEQVARFDRRKLRFDGAVSYATSS